MTKTAAIAVITLYAILSVTMALMHGSPLP